MVNFINNNDEPPFLKFLKFYKEAEKNKQEYIEAIMISSYCSDLEIPDSRFVNLKYVDNDEFIFFSNYNSPKSKQFQKNNKITAVIFWSSINIQIRMRAIISKKDDAFNDYHFNLRKREKNALAISSMQSEKIDSYEKVYENFLTTLNRDEHLNRPKYWGGFSFKPYFFEFWEGHESRVNKREVFNLTDSKWTSHFLQP